MGAVTKAKPKYINYVLNVSVMGTKIKSPTDSDINHFGFHALFEEHSYWDSTYSVTKFYHMLSFLALQKEIMGNHIIREKAQMMATSSKGIHIKEF